MGPNRAYIHYFALNGEFNCVSSLPITSQNKSLSNPNRLIKARFNLNLC